MTPEELREGLSKLDAIVGYADDFCIISNEERDEARACLAALRGMRVVAWYSGAASGELNHAPPFDGAIPLYTLERRRDEQ